jgi:glucokinase
VKSILLGDIGGTTARFALLNGDTLGPIEHIRVADHASVKDAIARFLGSDPGRPNPTAAILAIAGPIEAQQCTITNSHWIVDGDALRAEFGLAALKLVNDFEATAWALPSLESDDVSFLGGGQAIAGEPMVVIGPGTGLGMAAFVFDDGRAAVIATEGGHATLPSTSRREDEIISQLRERFGHVSAERVLSGPGLENLYQAVAIIEHAVVPARTAAEITQQALNGSCKICCAAMDVFCATLGTVAGNLALMFRARGGVYMAGGIAPRLIGYLAQSDFRERFVSKGRFRTYLEAVPTSVIIHEDPAFLGLRSLSRRLANR